MRKTIWFINEYNPIPGAQWKKSRSATICELLSEKYNVIWWTASFRHETKTHMPLGEIVISDSFKIEVVKSTSYKKHVSFKRIVRDNSFGKHLKKEIQKWPIPDLIITNGNPIRFCSPEYWYVKKHNVPVIVMMDDIWPDVIEMVLKGPMKPFIHLALLPMYKKRNKFFRYSNGFVATGTHHLNDLINMPGDGKIRKNECVYNGIDVFKFRELLHNKPSDSLNLPNKKDGEIWCVYSGGFGANYDIELIAKAAEYFEKTNPNIKFFLTGTGPLKSYVEQKSKELSNFTYLGLVSFEDLVALYGLCDIGLAPYKSGESIDMPDKLFDYFAAGLAVICSLNKDAGDYLNKYQAGLIFEPKNLQSFIKSIETLLDNNTLVQAKHNSYELGPTFDVRKQMPKFVRMVDEILNNQ